MGALQLGRNSLSISSRGSRGPRDHPGFSGALRSQRRPISISVAGAGGAGGALRPIGRGGNLLRRRWMGLRESPAAGPAICVNRLCNSQARVEMSLKWLLTFGRGRKEAAAIFLTLSVFFFHYYITHCFVFFFSLFRLYCFHNISRSVLYFSYRTPVDRPCTNNHP